MKKYECLYIVNINYDSEGNSTVITKVEEILKNVGAEIVNSQRWGKRKLAYAVDKEQYGNYVLIHFQGEDPKLADFHRELEIEKGVLHYMTIRLDEFPDFESLSIPQNYESSQHRPAYGGGRKPRQYGDDHDKPKQAPKTTDEPDVAETVKEAKVAVATDEPEVDLETETAEEPDVAETDEETKAPETTDEPEADLETETAEKPDVADTLEETELAAVEEVAEVVESIEEDTTDGAEEEADKPADAE